MAVAPVAPVALVVLTVVVGVLPVPVLAVVRLPGVLAVEVAGSVGEGDHWSWCVQPDRRIAIDLT